MVGRLVMSLMSLIQMVGRLCLTIFIFFNVSIWLLLHPLLPPPPRRSATTTTTTTTTSTTKFHTNMMHPYVLTTLSPSIAATNTATNYTNTTAAVVRRRVPNHRHTNHPHHRTPTHQPHSSPNLRITLTTTQPTAGRPTRRHSLR